MNPICDLEQIVRSKKWNKDWNLSFDGKCWSVWDDTKPVYIVQGYESVIDAALAAVKDE